VGGGVSCNESNDYHDRINEEYDYTDNDNNIKTRNDVVHVGC